jgi:hypothetical protein
MTDKTRMVGIYRPALSPNLSPLSPYHYKFSTLRLWRKRGYLRLTYRALLGNAASLSIMKRTTHSGICLWILDLMEATYVHHVAIYTDIPRLHRSFWVNPD